MALQLVARALCNHPNGTSVLLRNSLSPDREESLPAEHRAPSVYFTYTYDYASVTGIGLI